ncbi:pro-sigmaK processing inhibitor BofA [Tissierella creatinini]|nr:pro-sigmaK processing inhibitor BofA [Tissierella creatinini]TJX64552.1 pro-sigmaK processing inhibitor BofA [Soehngenia saccharolytica]
MDLSAGTLIAFLGGLVLLFFLGMLLVIPIKLIIKLIFNGIIGGVVLLLFNLVGGLFGAFIPINPLSAIIVGIFGVPGVILLLILQTIL